ncbi:GNAT family N-acetyltransferase [Pseudoflavonifractor sp. An85]|uniref:GNAT family N-acetyltransferase n=1 Tax=Pseudoflavonifractor sp. An85 TaxID=1965661 RepID=UPI000B39CC78|nr:GNAT family N-acetyltransferase [Pseudoflavonifractor sp. An85]OUN20959.1 GNAT family N-acetyltransferase [Pseudoflavonifractor sp. An85]
MQQLIYRNLTDDDKHQICAWKYKGEYGIYNLPPYEEMKAQQIGFMDPKSEQNYLAFADGDTLVGFVNILEEATEVFIGIGVNPELCNQHYGREMLALAYGISKSRYPDKPLYLEVRTWNTRAVKCYQRAGFQIDGEPYELTTGIGNGTFYRMTRV